MTAHWPQCVLPGDNLSNPSYAFENQRSLQGLDLVILGNYNNSFTGRANFFRSRN